MKIGRKIFVTLFFAVLLAGIVIFLFSTGIFGGYFSHPKKFNVNFVADENIVEVVPYDVTLTSIDEPEVPVKNGYEGKWESYNLTVGGDLTVNAVYTPIDYNLIFMGIDDVYAKYTYNIEGKTNLKSMPIVPKFQDYKGEWSEFTLEGSYGDIIVSALYTSKDATDGLTYTYDKNLSEYYVSGYEGDSSEVVIPSVYRNKNVVGINSNAFVNNRNIISVSLPKTLKTISANAFSGCEKLLVVYNFSEYIYNQDILDVNSDYGLKEYACKVLTEDDLIKNYENKSVIDKKDGFYFIEDGGNNYLIGYDGSFSNVNLPQNYNGNSYSVYDYAFYNDKNVYSVYTPFGNQILSIGKHAFDGCENLAYFDLGNIQNLDNTALYNCPRIEYLICDSSNANYQVNNGVLVDVSNPLELVILKATHTAILPTITGGSSAKILIQDYAFENNDMLTLSLPYYVTYVGDSAFKGCNDITKVNIQTGALFSSEESFFGRIFGAEKYGDNDKFVPNTLTEITVDFENGVIPNNAFFGCKSVKEFTVKDSVDSIGANAFSGCDSLVKITLSVAGSTADNKFGSLFGNAVPQSLKKVYISSKVTAFVEGAFSGFTNVEFLSIPVVNNFLNLFNGVYPSALNEVVVLGGELKPSAFANCNGLAKITLPENLTVIPESAFSGCSSLRAWPVNMESVTEIGVSAFENCLKLTGNLPFAFTKIGENSFNGTGLTVSNYNGGDYLGVENNPYYALISINNTLNSFTTNVNTVLIAGKAGANISDLYSIKINSNVRYISDNAFENTVIYEVYDLAGLGISKGNSNFGGVAISARVVHSNNYTNSIVLINNGLVFLNETTRLSLVKYTDNAENLVIDTPISNKLYYIENSVFVGKNIKTLVINNVLGIGNSCFCDCRNLVSVEIQGALTEVSVNSFMGCVALESISLPNTVQNVSSYAFYDCRKLKNINVPTSLNAIHDYAFFNTSLEEIYIKNSVSISNYAFVSNSKLVILLGGSDSAVGTYNKAVLINVNINHSCNFVFETNGGSAVESIDAWYLKDILSIPTKEGYTFAGWYLNSSCTVALELPYYSNARETTIYAKWIEN